MSTFLFLLFAFLVIVNASTSSRKEELSRIKHYELIHFNFDHFASDNQLEFDLFHQHYKIQLAANENMIPSLVNPIAGHPQSDKSTKWFTSRTSSCHYFGHIIEPQTKTAHVSSNDAALSLCPNRGVRGWIIIQNGANAEKIWVKPAAFYLDEEHRSQFYQLSDEHLVYRSSDFDRSGIPKARASKEKDPKLSPRVPSPLHSSRKLLASKALELYVLSDYAQVDEYKDDHGSDWYEQLLSTAFDWINAADAEYVNLGQVGDIDIKLVRFEVVESWSGEYSALRPDDYSRSEIDGSEYLSTFKEWLSDTDRNIYDAHQLWTTYGMDNAMGWGSVGCVCDSHACASNVAALSRYGDSENINTVAHELGHNFGARHDDDAGCDDDEGIMGRASHGFSDCSIEAFEDHYDDTSSLSCLRDGTRSFSSNHGSGQSPDDGNDNNDNYNPPSTGNTGAGETEIFYDPMENLNAWSASSPSHISISSDHCVSNRCVKIKGYSDSYDYITRDVSNSYTSYRLKFDVILDNMESDNSCDVYVIFDSGNWQRIKSYPGSSSQTYRGQSVTFNSVTSARTLTVSLDTTGDSSSGNDVCYWDNVYLYGSGSTGRYEEAPCLAENPYADSLCLYKGNEEHAFELSTADGCINGEAVYKYNGNNDSYYLSCNKYQQWVVSVEEIKTFGSFVCDELNLLDCIDGKWKALISNGEDAEELVVDKDISIEACTVATNKAMSSDMRMYVVAFVIVGLLLIASIVGLVVVLKKKKTFKGVRVEDEDAEDIEVAVEMETDSQMNTKI